MPLVNSVINGTESISFLGPEVWEHAPEEVKQKESLNSFKDAIKELSPNNSCHCRFTQKKSHGVGFLI